MSDRIAIIGASGFVGSALTEYLLDHTNHASTPFCHSTGGAARLAHRKCEIRRLDLLDRDAVATAIRGFDYVVNCSRGGKQLMLSGLDNLLRASRKAGVKKLVHLSSVAVYGDPPHPASTSEDAPTEPAPGSYGAMKLLQDQMVRRAAAGGLNSVILCPPNIVGPYSDYLIDIINSIERGRFRLLDGGTHPINIVDVNNLSACVVSALHSDVCDGRRFFVCEPAEVNWGRFCSELEAVIRDHPEIPNLSGNEFAQISATADVDRPRSGPSNGPFKHLLSDEVRGALRLHPVWASLEARAKAGVRRLGRGTEDHLRNAISGPIKVQVARRDEPFDRNLIAQQLRGIKHDPSRSHRDLGFNPPLSFAQSMQSFRDWYVQHFEAGSAEWALLGRAAQ